MMCAALTPHSWARILGGHFWRGSPKYRKQEQPADPIAVYAMRSVIKPSEASNASCRRYRSSRAERRRLRPLAGFLRQAARLPRLQAQIRLRGNDGVEQRQDLVLDRRRRRARAAAQISQ